MSKWLQLNCLGRLFLGTAIFVNVKAQTVLLKMGEISKLYLNVHTKERVGQIVAAKLTKKQFIGVRGHCVWTSTNLGCFDGF